MKRQRSIAHSTILVATVGVLAAFAWQQDSTPPPAPPPAITHSAEGRDDCLMCHKAGAIEPVPDVPANHVDRPSEICLMCHAPDAAVQTTAPVAVPHSLEGRDDCLMCHTVGAMEPVPDVPEDHVGRENAYCTLCHQPA